jgi:hypothetical protein
MRHDKYLSNVEAEGSFAGVTSVSTRVSRRRLTRCGWSCDAYAEGVLPLWGDAASNHGRNAVVPDAHRTELVPVLIALLALLGVNLALLACIVLAVLGRRRWVRSQSGSFAGVGHAISGDPGGMGSRPRRGYGRWVHDVLVWTPAPLFVSRLAPIDRVGTHAPEKHVRRLGEDPVVVTFDSGDTRFEITTRSEDRDRALGPFAAKHIAEREAHAL